MGTGGMVSGMVVTTGAAPSDSSSAVFVVASWPADRTAAAAASRPPWTACPGVGAAAGPGGSALASICWNVLAPEAGPAVVEAVHCAPAQPADTPIRRWISLIRLWTEET